MPGQFPFGRQSLGVVSPWTSPNTLFLWFESLKVATDQSKHKPLEAPDAGAGSRDRTSALHEPDKYFYANAYEDRAHPNLSAD